jgi:hypothetical protein
MRIDECHAGQLDAVKLTGHDIGVLAVPGLGAKLASIEWQGREVLARNPRRPLRPARYAASYAALVASGFDDCLPTIGPCPYPDEPWTGIEVPDHGEVWSIPWSLQADGDRLQASTHGVRFPYTFEKTIELPPAGGVRLSYALTNHAPFPFRFLWSAHPLLALKPGMRIHLPAGTRVRVDWSKGDRLGGLLAEHPWPLTHDRSGQAVDLGLILGAEAGLVDKLFTTRLTDGWCGLHDPADGFYVAMLFSPERVPYVGLSINLGGWPVDGPGSYNLGLEPCNGYPDRLDVAIAQGDCAVAAPGGRLEWLVDLRLGRCADLPAEVARLRSGSVME